MTAIQLQQLLNGKTYVLDLEAKCSQTRSKSTPLTAL